MTTGKTIALTIWTFVGRVMSLIFNMLYSFFIAFLSRNKCLLVLWKQSPSAMILKFKKRKYVIVSTFTPFYLELNDGTRYHDLNLYFFLNTVFPVGFFTLFFHLHQEVL